MTEDKPLDSMPDDRLPEYNDYPHQLQIYTGDNKGKTTAAVGMAIRALGAGLKVALIQFDKGFTGGDEHYSERNILRKLDGLELVPTGLERMSPGRKFRFGVTDGDRAEAHRGLETAMKFISEKRHQLLVLDEVLSAITYHLVKEPELLAVIDEWFQTRPFDLVLTGRRASPGMIERADLVTEMTKVKHYFDNGIPARRGFDF